MPVYHTALLTSQPGKEQDLDSLLQQLATVSVKMAGVISFTRGSYNSKEGLNAGLQTGFTITFRDEDARDAYLGDPEHKVLVEQIVPLLADPQEFLKSPIGGLVFDYKDAPITIRSLCDLAENYIVSNEEAIKQHDPQILEVLQWAKGLLIPMAKKPVETYNATFSLSQIFKKPGAPDIVVERGGQVLERTERILKQIVDIEQAYAAASAALSVPKTQQAFLQEAILQQLQKVYDFYDKKDIPFLIKQLEEAKATKPYKGLTIYHNIPLTMEAVLKTVPLLLGGADVTMSCIKALPPQENALKILQKAGVKIDLSHNITTQFDIYLDCCAELANALEPRLGTVELTQTGTQIYQTANLPYPVISVDDSKLKHLEGIGTGYGFIAGLKKYLPSQTTLQSKAFVIFGGGKIGLGVAKALQGAKANVSVVEKSADKIAKLNKAQIETISIADKQLVRSYLKGAFCVVTATGVPNCLSDNFDKKDFGDAYLANMGPDDEFGDKFSSQEVLFEKRPINFAADSPTEMRYLDPVFYAHNKAIDLLVAGQARKGYQPFANDLAEEILGQWRFYHKEDVDDFIKEGQTEKNDSVGKGRGNTDLEYDSRKVVKDAQTSPTALMTDQAKLSLNPSNTPHGIFQPAASKEEDLLLQLALWLSSIDFKCLTQKRKLFGLQPVSVSFKNGNCLFEAVAAFTTPGSTGHDIRKQVVDYIRRNDQLRERINKLAVTPQNKIRMGSGEDVTYVSSEDYLDKMDQDQTWGTGIELAALAYMSLRPGEQRRPIVLLTPNNMYDRILPEEGNYDPDNPIFLNYIGDNYYVPLAVPAGQNPRIILKQIHTAIVECNQARGEAVVGSSSSDTEQLRPFGHSP